MNIQSLLSVTNVSIRNPTLCYRYVIFRLTFPASGSGKIRIRYLKNRLKYTVTPFKWLIFVFCCMLDICVNACLLKNITLAGKSIFMGMKMDFHAYVFRFKRMGILEKINNKHAQPRIKKHLTM